MTLRHVTNPLVDAIELLRTHRANELLQMFRDDTWRMSATLLRSLTADERRDVLRLLPIATSADRVRHVAFTNADIDGDRTDAVSWLEVPVGRAAASATPNWLVLYPFLQRPGQDVEWSAPIEMGPESAVFGGLVDSVSDATEPSLTDSDASDAARIAALDRLTRLDIAVEMSEDFSAEVHALLERAE